MIMIKGKTVSGFVYEIDEHRLDDMELLELVAEADENMTLMPKVLSKLLGKKQKKRLYDFCREKNGNVPVEKTVRVMEEIFRDSPLKKS
jgi:hypothetical protein|nr:MAG TPA: hypothetical protein [Caudoviricetes sp.]